MPRNQPHFSDCPSLAPSAIATVSHCHCTLPLPYPTPHFPSLPLHTAAALPCHCPLPTAQHLQITDRSKDVIKSGGEWISSIEIENAAVGHPQVAGAPSGSRKGAGCGGPLLGSKVCGLRGALHWCPHHPMLNPCLLAFLPALQRRL
jgi:hypothetical protein